MSEQRKIPQDRYGSFFFEVGDLVSRDGTDVHRVIDHNGSDGYAPDGFTVMCVKAPPDGWTEVGEEEFNTCRRYNPVSHPAGSKILLSPVERGRIKRAAERAIAGGGRREILGQTAPMHFASRPAPHMPEYVQPDFGRR